MAVQGQPHRQQGPDTTIDADTGTGADFGGGESTGANTGTGVDSAAAWERKVAQAWDGIDGEEPGAFRAHIRALAAERPDGDAAALFELAAAYDSTGEPHEAEPLYLRALEAGLTGLRRRRAVIQLASTLRNLGRPREGVALLEAERASGVSDDLDDALVCVLALGLTHLGRAREGVGLLVEAMAPHLPRYNRSMAAYGAEMVEQARAAAVRRPRPAAGPVVAGTEDPGW